MQKILKVRIDNISLQEATKKACSWAQGKEQKMIATPNPEFLLAAQKNPKFLRILNQADLNIADGIGILWASKYLKISAKNKSKILKFCKWLFSLLSILFYPKYIRSELKERVSGADLMLKICSQAAKAKSKIFLLGAAPGVAFKVKETLEKKYPKINISGNHSGSPSTNEDAQTIKKINESHANILFVAFGAPAQEFWIARNLKKLQTVKVALGIGGTFDYIAGVHKRSPRWMQKLGLEWLYRLLHQPARIRRIHNAIIKFPVKVF